jgi:hypothetical protein
MWSGVGPLVGVLIGAWSARSWQRKQWELDNRGAEYRELITVLSQSVYCIIKNGPFRMRLVRSEQQRESEEAMFLGQRNVRDRIFMDRQMREAGIPEFWEGVRIQDTEIPGES